jgi:Calcineurin-like phosphoesterase
LAKRNRAKTLSAHASSLANAGRMFGEPKPTPGETKFVDQRTDEKYYRLLNPTLLQPIPEPSISPPRMSLQDVIGAPVVKKIQASGKIVFHAVGDTGVTAPAGPGREAAVTDKMAADFDEQDPSEVPSFLYHLGDVIYNFGEDEYYYDQFYEPFRNYEAPIFAIPGNHDGVVYSGEPQSSLGPFLQQFCSPTSVHSPQAGGLVRTTMTQPGVYFTLSAPYVTIIGLYTNVLEDPGIISSEEGKNPQLDDQQLDFLKLELKRLHDAKYSGALILATHHPPYTIDTTHGSSPGMMADIEEAITYAGNYWPHALISGHVHNYERYTRAVGKAEIPFIIAGSGGHDITKIRTDPLNKPIRVPLKGKNGVTLERYYPDYGYLRVIASAEILTFEFHDVSSVSSKSPADVCSIDLQSRTLTTGHA